MEVSQGELSGLLILKPDVFADDRGWFMEVWNRARCSDTRLPAEFVQDNQSFSRRGVLRGLHFQNPRPQGKLVHVLQGTVFDVVVDLRRDSATFGRWFGLELSGENRLQLYVPEGFAHGFQAITDPAVVSYKCTRSYEPQAEHTLRWDDPDVGVQWPLASPALSPKDARGRLLKEFAPETLF
jgi:dTDP-4-dehydrorhamnose 3,5-epimerase